ncbi:D-glycero-beta-D-manno-heptose 1-phosphate adenylyltransferase [Planctopirus hydrillae]|uniref:Bifunctional protein HldE n=1 Tax=Planctopirus hydrillae TaxID=1841610 RepID=A0A1C3EDJ2_9PLAN|nr:D-glycero-beta-D-manno-heptose 1-phosphate adenylyltransferase [Planctopirus hydrillae]ODA31270.1 bifunctional heptose 7-phosphate kinase/heptose 1-phosphate adenyltransferase [Planctopirus hydrillae]
MSYHLIDAVERLGCPRLLVVGDLILDRYVWGDAERISQEAPVILLHEQRQELRLGGAANVAQMVKGLDAEVTLLSIIGADEEGRQACRELERLDIDSGSVCIDPSRPTTLKTRYMGSAQYRHPHQMLRVDREVRNAIDSQLATRLLNQILPHLKDFQAILVSDYGKGLCTQELLEPLIAAARKAGIPVVVDPASHGKCAAYRGATSVTPNRLETTRATGVEVRTVEDAFVAGKKLCELMSLDYAFVTMDRDGIALVHNDGTSEHLPTRPREVCDITGAGDMVMAMIGVGLGAGLAPADLGRLANVAGGLEVEQIGVVAISREEILTDLMRTHRHAEGKILNVPALQRHVSARQKTGQKVVFTNGCFDLLHAGHVSYLTEAACEGQCLIVAINSDDSVRRLGKAPDRPIFDQEYRARMLAALEVVDYVVVFDEDTPHALLHALKPDVLVKGGTYSAEEIVGREVVLAYGGTVKPMGMVEGLSTTQIVRRLREQDATVLSLAAHTQAVTAPASAGHADRKAA